MTHGHLKLHPNFHHLDGHDPSNRGFAEWGDLFGHPVVATALLDRLLHHAIVIQIGGASYRLRQHADLIPENLRVGPLAGFTPPPRRRGRPPKHQPTPSLLSPNRRRRLPWGKLLRPNWGNLLRR